MYRENIIKLATINILGARVALMSMMAKTQQFGLDTYNRLPR